MTVRTSALDSDPPAPSAARAGRHGRPTHLWWISPLGAMALTIPLMLYLTWVFSDRTFRAEWGMPKVITHSTILLLASGAMAFAIGALWPQLSRNRKAPTSWPHLDGMREERFRAALEVLWWLTLAGYLVYLASGLMHGLTIHTLVASFTSQNSEQSDLRQTIPRVKGLTTLTQVGIAFITVASLVVTRARSDRKLRRRMVILLLMALVRSFLLSERLAVIEIAVPMAAVLAARAVNGSSARGRRLARFAPVILIPALIVFFGALEYSRSWAFYKTRTTESFPTFVVHRLTGYYVTANNNGQLELNYDNYPGRLPYSSLEFLWTAPGVSQHDLYGELSGRDSFESDEDQAIANDYGNPEYNSPGGLAVGFVDYGRWGGLVLYFLLGSVIGLAYRAFMAGSTVGLVAYPPLVTGLLEFVRYLYWTQGRVITALVFLAGVVLYVERRQVRAWSRSTQALPA
jgi:oligosaccharide repeat unit polymerase